MQKIGLIKKFSFFVFIKKKLNYYKVRPCSKIKKRPVVIGFVLILVVVSAYFLFFSSSEVLAEWWDTNWHYRKAITITNSGSAQTDFQVKILSNYDMSTDVTNGKVQADFDDLRFTDINGNALNYWIEDNTAASLDVWVKIDSIPTNASTVYMYYGNANTSAKSDSSLVPNSCSDINATMGDGVYYIDPDGVGGNDAFQVYCDMTINGGGWTLIMNRRGGYGSIEACGTNMNDFLHNTCGSINNIGYGDSYSIDVDLMPDGDEYLFYNMNSSSVIDTDDAFIIHSSVNIFPDSIGTTNNIIVTSVCDYSNVNCDTTDVYWKYDGNGFFSGANCSSGHSSGYGGNYGYCQNGITSYACNGLFGDRNAYNEAGLWSYWQIGRRRTFVRSAEPPDVSISATLQSEEKSPGPVGYWSFDEGYGTTAQDRTSNNNDGTISGALWQTEDMCVSGKCLYFDGSGDYVLRGDSASLDMSGNFTVESWVKLTGNPTSTYSPIVSKIGSLSCGVGNPDGYLTGISDTRKPRLRLMWNSGAACGTYDSSTTLSINKWYHLVYVFDNSASKVYFYIDGSLDTTKSVAWTGDISNSEALKIGSYIKGFIDEPKIYPYARTAAQIKAGYNAGKAGLSSDKGSAVSLGGPTSIGGQSSLSDGLVGYWKMDEASGNAVDSSGNENTGTWYGTGSHYPAGKFGNGGGFNGTDDYVDCGDDESLNVSSTDSYTVSFWLYQYSQVLTWDEVVWHNTTGNKRIHFNVFQSNIQRWEDFEGPAIPLNQWKFITYTFSSDGENYGTEKFYNDGVFYAQRTGSMPVPQVASPLHISGVSTASTVGAFNGKIDEVRIYNRALSEREVKALYEWAPGPVGHWKMDEHSGSYAYDTSGNGYNGSFITGTEWTNGKYGSAVDLNGSTTGPYDSVDINTIGTKLEPKHAITVGAWVYKRASDGWPLSRYSSSSRVSYGIHSSYVRMHFVTAGLKDISISYTSNEWHYISLTYDGSSMKVYVDGVLQGQIDSINDEIYYYSGYKFFIGRLHDYNYGGGVIGNQYFDGLIDDVRIYNYARTQKQILEDMLSGRPASKSPVGYWKFDEGYGTSTKDSSIYGNDGTITGADWTNAGKLGKALDFNGTSDYVEIVNGGDLSFTSELSVGAWFKHDATSGSDSIVTRLGTGGSDNFNLYFSTTALTFGMRDSNCSTWQSISSTISDTLDWHYVTATYDGSYSRLYIDGELKNTISSAFSVCTSPISNMRIGAGAVTPANFFDGLIDELKIYNYALIEEEIKAEYNQGKVSVMGAVGGDGSGSTSSAGTAEYCVPGDTATCTPPVAEWKFEEHAGTYAYDTSGNGNTGTLTNMEETDWTVGKIGGGLDFDGGGSNEYVDCENNSSLNPSNGITRSFWMYSDNFSQVAYPLRKSNQYYAYLHTNDVYYIRCFDAAANQINYEPTYAAMGLTNGNWHHIVITFDGYNLKLYVNGNYIGQGTGGTGGVRSDQGSNLLIGGFAPYYFNGLIDQVRIYDYARTPAQVAWDYNKGKPIAHYKMDKGEGTTIYDSSGNGNNGTLTLGALGQTSAGSVKVNANTAWYNGREGKQNYSLNFDGSDDYVDMGDVSILDMGNNDFSMAAWFNCSNNTEDRTILAKGSHWWWSDPGAVGYGMGIYGSTIYAAIEDGSTEVRVNGSIDYDDGQWHHAMVSVDRSDYMKLYIDGNFIDQSDASSIGDLNNSIHFVLSRYRYNQNQSEWDGQIDEVKIFNYALTASQIKTEYNLGAAHLGTGN